MAKGRLENWLVAGAAAIGLGITALMGLREYMETTAEQLHATAEAVPSVVEVEPPPRWNDAAARARQAVRAHLVARNLPGLSIAVGIDGAPVWAEGFGWSDLEQRIPVTADTRFRVGTISMALTSVAIGTLVEDGRLDLDADIRRYVPTFPAQTAPVTSRQLMGHVAGLRNDGGDEGPLLAAHCERPADALAHLDGLPLSFAPGTDYRVSAYGWVVLSAAVEAAAGEPFTRAVRKRVLEPAGMLATAPDATTERIDDRATFYFPRFAADPRYGLHLMRPLDYSCYAGASVYLSTAADLVRFGLAVQRHELLREETTRLLQTSLRLPSGRETGYGLGWDLETATLGGHDTPVVGHDGDVLGGQTASLLTVPSRGLVVAVLANISYAATAELATRVADAFVSTAAAPPW